jgi:hypothetical protein
MSAMWSLTYFKAIASEREFFDAVVETFRAELDGKLYGLDWSNLQDSAIVNLKSTFVEWFDSPKRARLITDSHLLERLCHGVLVFPAQNGLITIADTVIQIGDIYSSGRTRRSELAAHLIERPDPHAESLFQFIRFLSRLTGLWNTQAVHLMFERNPATRTTATHFYDSGQLVDDYCYENIECEDRFEVELPLHPELIRQILDGRFAFLSEQPKHRQFDDDTVEVYFDGEDLGRLRNDPDWDVFNLRTSDLYVPFWDENNLPLGAVYSLHDELPDFFLQRY